MISANELRIGNWVKSTGINIPRMQIESSGYVKITGNGISMIEQKVWNDVEPIPLTPEILEKCGFEKSYDSYYRVKYQHIENSSIEYVFIGNSNETFATWRGEKVFITYLHQLQNLYFALTGTELTINL